MTSGVKWSLEEIAVYKEKILHYIEQTPGGTLFGACSKLKVGYSTGYVWRKDDPEWAAKVDEARKLADEVGGDFAEGKLMSCIQKDIFPAIKFYLTTKHKHRGYSEKQEVFMDSKVNTTNDNPPHFDTAIEAQEYLHNLLQNESLGL